MGSTTAINEQPSLHPPAALQTSFAQLPSEIIMHLFSFLKGYQAASLSPVCRQWQLLLSDASLWKHYLQREFHEDAVEQPREHYKKKFLPFFNFNHGIYAIKEATFTQNAYQPCGSEHAQKKVFSFGPINGEIKDLAIDGSGHLTLKKTGSNNYSLELIEGSCFLSSDAHGTITTFVSEQDSSGKTFTGHRSPVTSNVITYEDILIAGYADGVIKVWNREDETCICKIITHATEVRYLILTEVKNLISGHADGSIMTWTLAGEILDLQEAKQPITSLLLIDEKKLVASHDDGTIQFWDYQNGVCEQTTKAHSEGPLLRLTADGDLITQARVGVINIWDPNTNSLKFSINNGDHHLYSSKLVVKDRQLIIADSNGVIKIWNLNNGNLERTLKTKQKCEFLQLADDDKLILGNQSGKLLILDFSASHSEVLREFASKLAMNPSTAALEELMQRFSWMPSGARNKIYEELERVLKSGDLDFCGSGEEAFHNGTLPQQKACAIERYLIQLWSQSENNTHNILI